MVSLLFPGILGLTVAHLICLIAGQHTGQKIIDNEKANLKMSVYYETLCPDSLNILENQLLDIFSTKDGSVGPKSLESHVDIQLIPYGKAATFEAEGESTKFSFICQHGPLECEGNKLHSCAIQSASKIPEIRPINLIKFLTCSMKHLMVSPEPPLTFSSQNITSSIIYPVFESCFEEFQLQSPELSSAFQTDIEGCLEDGESSLLLKTNGEITSHLTPKLSFVPWVTFNGVWRKRLMDGALKNLRKVLCQLVITDSLASSSTVNPEIEGCEVYYTEVYAGFLHQRNLAPIPGGDFEPISSAKISPSPSNNAEPLEMRTRYGRGAAKRIGGIDRRRFIHAEMDIPYGGWRTQGHGYQRVSRDWRRPIIR